MITIRNFSYRFRGSERYALRDVNLDIAQGEFAVLTGPSGCGKSTLALAIGGFLFNQYDGEATGDIHVGGVDVRRAPVYDTAEIVGLVQQNPEAQFCTLTVQDEIAFGLENRMLPRDEIRKRITWVLDVTGAQALQNRPLATLSGGEKQRVAVAAMLAARPQVLIFDEPTSNLDPTATAHIFNVIARIREIEHITVIVIEHKVDYLRRFAPRWLKMDGGQIVERANGTLDTDFHRFSRIKIKKSVGIRENQRPKNPLIKTNHLHAGYNGHRVLHDVSVEIGPGEFVAVMGDNGSGKTTFLQCLLGLLKPEQGHVEVLGQDTRKAPVSRLARHVAYIFQNPDHQLFAETVWQEATLAPRNFGMWNEATETLSVTLLAETGLGDRHNDHPYRLSYGEKRRLNLVAMLTYAPRLLLLDEILIGQDPGNAARLLQWLLDHVSGGSSVVLINHAPEITQRYATRLLFFDAGRLVINAPTAQAFEQLAALGYPAYLPSTTKSLSLRSGDYATELSDSVD